MKQTQRRAHRADNASPVFRLVAPLALLCAAALSACGGASDPTADTSSGSGSGGSSGGSETPPTITAQPQDQTVAAGSTATFTVTASGSAPLSYQWSKSGTAISGATGASYTTPATVSGDTGATFTVLVTNSAGSQTSNPATLTVDSPPLITTQPQNQSVTAGAAATFGVVATGTAPLAYQWLKSNVAISGATGSTYTTPVTTSADNNSTFAVTVSNSAGSQTSRAATLTVTAAAVAPTIVTQPQNQTVMVGSMATFSVLASGTAPLSYQWSKNGAAILNATGASYTTPATANGDNGAMFTVTVSNAAGSQVSTAATLIVTAAPVAPTITLQPQNQAVALGSMATFTVMASGTAPLSYQWSKNGATISGATGASYTTPATVSGDNGATFTVKVSNSAGSQTSNAATLIVNLPPTITTQPQNQTVVLGSAATFSVVASGTAPLSYQWSKNGTAIGNATGSSYTTPATVSGDSGSTFAVKVSNSFGSQTSNAATLTVNSSTGAATPIMFQHIASSADPVTSGIPGRNFVFHVEALPANTVAVMAVSTLTGVTATISDTLAGSWSSPVCSAGGTGEVNAVVFVQPLGAAGGADTIMINVGNTDTQPVQFDITFWQNISTTAPVNGTLCKGSITPSSGGVIAAGSSFTPTANDAAGGNLIWNYVGLACHGYSMTSVTNWNAGASFTLLNGGGAFWLNDAFPQASQSFIQTTAAAITPSIAAVGENATNGDCFNSLTVALAVANNGAVAPSAIHVAKIIHETVTVGRTSVTGPFPTTGNLRVIPFGWESGCPGGGPPCISSVSSSDGCPWTIVGSEANGDSVLAYAQNCVPCPSCTVTLNFSSSGAAQGSFRMYDVVNAAASSYQNEVSGNGSCGSGTLNNAPTITPAVSSGLTIAAVGIGTGPGLSVTSPAGATFDLWTFTDQTDADTADNADLLAHYYFSTNATQNWDWTLHPSSCYWVAAVFD